MCTCRATPRHPKKSFILSHMPGTVTFFQLTAWWLLHHLPLQLSHNPWLPIAEVNWHLKRLLLGGSFYNWAILMLHFPTSMGRPWLFRSYSLQLFQNWYLELFTEQCFGFGFLFCLFFKQTNQTPPPEIKTNHTQCPPPHLLATIYIIFKEFVSKQ